MRSPRWLLVGIVLAMGAMSPLTACAPERPVDPFDFSGFLGEDGLFHDRDVAGIDGALTDGSATEGTWTTAAVIRTRNLAGEEVRLATGTSRALDAAAQDAVDGGDPDAVLGAARACALAAQASAPCREVRGRAIELLQQSPAARGRGDSGDSARAVLMIETAADLGVLPAGAGSSLAAAVARRSDDPCVDSAVVRLHVRRDDEEPLRVVDDPRARTDEVLAALRIGDVDTAYCLSGIVAATAGATPDRDEDWLQQPFDEAVAAGFTRADDGLYAGADRSQGRIETTRRLSQVSFDLSVGLGPIPAGGAS